MSARISSFTAIEYCQSANPAASIPLVADSRQNLADNKFQTATLACG